MQLVDGVAVFVFGGAQVGDEWVHGGWCYGQPENRDSLKVGFIVSWQEQLHVKL